MINVLEVSTRFQDEWVVLDRSQRVVDHGPDLQQLWRKHHGLSLTFYFASGQR